MAAHDPDGTRDTKLSAAANEYELDRFTKACVAVNLKNGATIRELAMAFATHVEKYGKVSLPFKLESEPMRPE